jgi:hypothetical protein
MSDVDIHSYPEGPTNFPTVTDRHSSPYLLAVPCTHTAALDEIAIPFVLSTISVIEGNTFIALQGFHALIGRDILSKCVFTYNGDAGCRHLPRDRGRERVNASASAVSSMLPYAR